jgi:hypothetical protein
MRQVVDLLEEGGVDVVFCGHVHNYQRTHPVRSSEGARDRWEFDRRFDGKGVTKADGVVFVTEGAGGGPVYDPQFADKPSTWKPWTAAYKARHGFGVLDIDGRKLTYRHLGTDGQTKDSWILTK